MATYDLNRSELNGLLAADHIDPSVRQAIINYLVDDHSFSGPGRTVAVQESGYPPLDRNAQVLLVDTPFASVQTDAHLQAIVDISDATLKVTGSNNVLIATGPGNDKVDITGTSGKDI